ncbi:transposase [Streptococcus pneumoniae GA47502]|nr:transposase [Streptococcus pneumoniae GA47502]
MNYFKGKQFQKDVIIVAVGYYLRYNLSYREIQELLYDRGINVCHTTIYRWVQEYSKVLYHLWKKKIDSPSIRGKWMKLISKLKVVGIISIVQLMRMD